MKFIKIISLTLVAVFVLTAFCSCSKKSATTIRFLNFKPEIAGVYEKIAKEYEKETGVKVIVETAANNEYETTLMSKMATDEAPTLFQINGPRALASWKDYCADLSETKLYEHLVDKTLALKSGGKIYGIPYVVEGYGIIYNQAILDKYFSLKDKSTDFTSVDEIVGFDALKAVVEDMQKHKAELGIDGVFAPTSLKAGEDWRWQTHLANIPIYHEFVDRKVDLASKDTKKIDFRYAKNFKNIFDLYINNSVTDKKLLGTKTVDDSMASFALGRCAMVQNGNWAWGQISGVKGNKVKENDIKFMPIYTGVSGEEKHGLCVGTENFMCINSQASKDEQAAAQEFIYWLYSSEKGKDYVRNELGFIAPFDTFTDEEKPTDPLAKQVVYWMQKQDVLTIPWNFTLFPSQTFKDKFGAGLLQYAQGTKSFETLKSEVVSGWKKESAVIE